MAIKRDEGRYFLPMLACEYVNIRSGVEGRVPTPISSADTYTVPKMIIFWFFSFVLCSLCDVGGIVVILLLFT